MSNKVLTITGVAVLIILGFVVGHYIFPPTTPPDPDPFPRHLSIGHVDEDGECTIDPDPVHMWAATQLVVSNYSHSTVTLTFPTGLWVEGTDFEVAQDDKITLTLDVESGTYAYGVTDEVGCVGAELPGPLVIIP